MCVQLLKCIKSSVLRVACGGGSASAAGDSYSTTTAVMISSYFLSGSFHLSAGRLEGGASLLYTIK